MNMQATEDLFDSDEELWFSWYLEELRLRGLVDKWERAKSFQLSDAVRMTFIKPATGKHKKERHVEKDWVSGHVYTPDFKIWWRPSACDAGLVQCWQFEPAKLREDVPFIANIDPSLPEMTSLIEVKPMFDAHGKTQWSSMQIKWVMAKFNLHVQMVKIGTKPKCLFDRTFTPQRFLLTDKTLKPRALKYNPKSADEYLNSLLTRAV